MPRRLPAHLLAAALAALLLAACGERDGDDETVVAVRELLMVTTIEAIELPGQKVPADTDTVTLWLGPGLARRDAEGGSYLVDTHRDLLAYVDHEAGTWTRATSTEVADLLAALARDTVRGADPRTERLKSLLRVAARVTDMDETAVIDGYQCRRWVVVQAFGDQRTTTELWLTREIDVDYSLLHRATRPSLLALPGGEEALAELNRLRGVPVLATSVLEVMGRQTRSVTRLHAVARDTLPLSFFSPPAAYHRAGPVDGLGELP